MTEAAIAGPAGKAEASLFRRPHLSHSRIQRYLHCPEQYRLYYVENLRPRVPSANLVFGKTLHGALAHLFQGGEDPVESFRKFWQAARENELNYSRRDTWEKLNETGQALLRKFVAEDLPRLGNVRAVERPFELAITGLELPLVGVVDLVAGLDGLHTVVDFKTAASAYGDHEATLSDQLTAYRLAEPEVEQLALCVLVKTRTPRIDWHVARRGAEQVQEYLAKVRLVAREIADGRFYKRPGTWCAWCDFLPVCMGDRKRVRETLIQIR